MDFKEPSPIFSSDNVDKNTFGKFEKIVLAGGCFDILHYGHLQFLKASKEKGSSLILLLESDSFIINRKKRSPYHIQQERSELLASVCFVDGVINLMRIFSDEDYAEIIKKIHPSVISITEGDLLEDKKKKHAQLAGSDFICFPKFPFSSSNILTYASISRD